MGYRPNRRLDLVFGDDTEYAGLRITMRRMSLARALELDEYRSGDHSELEVTRRVADLFAEFVVSWNLEDEDGRAVPPTAEALMAEEPAFFRVVTDTWADQAMGVPAPLDATSTPGPREEDLASMPTETLPANLSA